MRSRYFRVSQVDYDTNEVEIYAHSDNLADFGYNKWPQLEDDTFVVDWKNQMIRKITRRDLAEDSGYQAFVAEEGRRNDLYRLYTSGKIMHSKYLQLVREGRHADD